MQLAGQLPNKAIATFSLLSTDRRQAGVRYHLFRKKVNCQGKQDNTSKNAECTLSETKTELQ